MLFFYIYIYNFYFIYIWCNRNIYIYIYIYIYITITPIHISDQPTTLAYLIVDYFALIVIMTISVIITSK